MRSRFKYLLVLTLPVMMLRSVFAAEPKPLQDWIRQQMGHYHIAGASVAIIEHRRIVWRHSFGYRDRAKRLKVTNQTLFNAASISKPIAALATIMAFDDKSLSFDRNVNDYLTAWKLPETRLTQNDPVTMGLLLSHTAGITGFRCKGYTRNAQLPTFLQVLNGQPPANTPPVTVVRKPGRFYEYSPAGYMIIQEVLMNLYHRSFPFIMNQLILQPLSMKSSYFGVTIPNKSTRNYARSYLPNGRLMPQAPLRFMAQAAGGLWTTASDLATFVIAVERAARGRSTVISAHVIRRFFRPSLNHNMAEGIEINLNSYGEEVKHGDYFGHSGWNSGYLGFMLGSQHFGNGMVILVNSAPYMTYKGRVRQYDFLSGLVKYVAKQRHWRNA